MMDIRGLASIVDRCYDKESSSSNTSGSGLKSEIMTNKEFAEELQRPFIRKFQKRKVYPSIRRQYLQCQSC